MRLMSCNACAEYVLRIRTQYLLNCLAWKQYWPLAAQVTTPTESSSRGGSLPSWKNAELDCIIRLPVTLSFSSSCHSTRPTVTLLRAVLSVLLFLFSVDPHLCKAATHIQH
jgi:hypothetical protein